MTYQLLTLQQWDIVEYRCELRRREKVRAKFGYGCLLACPTFDEDIESALLVWCEMKGWLEKTLAASEN